jgi:hypothetical protein
MKIIFNNQRGSLLVEILLAILIAGAIIGAVSGLVFTSQKSGQTSGIKNSAVALAQEGFEAAGSISETDWHNIYLPPDGTGDPINDKGGANPYYVYKSGSSWALGKIMASEGDIEIGGIIYARKIYIYNVNRNSGGDREIVTVGGAEDPSTQKIKMVISTTGSQDVIIEGYLTRWKNRTFNQANWFGGAGQAGPIATPNTQYFSDDGNIDTGTPGSIKLKQ